MTRSIVVVIIAAVLSWILLVVGVYCWLSWSQSGRFVRDQGATTRDYASVQREYGDPFGLLNRGKRQQEVVIFPLISVVVGIVVGLSLRKRPGWLAILALAPLQVFLLAANRFMVWAFVRTFAYLLLAYLCATKVRITSHGSDSEGPTRAA